MSATFQNNPVSNFSRGFFYPFRAVRFFLKNPGLTKYIAIPFGINLTVFSLLVYWGLDFFNEVVVHYIPQGEAWYWSILYYALWVVAVVLTTVLVFFTFTVVGNLIASPFNELLSERTEEILRGKKMKDRFSLKQFFWDMWRIMWDESKKISLFVFAMALLLLLNLLPGVGSVLYSVLSLLLTLFFLGIEYTGYVFERKHLGFQEQRRFVMSRKFLMFGFSFGVLCFLMVPFLQFFCIPAAVIAATHLWFDTESGPMVSSLSEETPG